MRGRWISAAPAERNLALLRRKELTQLRESGSVHYAELELRARWDEGRATMAVVRTGGVIGDIPVLLNAPIPFDAIASWDVPRIASWSDPRDAVRLLLSGTTARACLPVALVVGTILRLVNQGDVVAQGMAGGVVVVKVLANYAIPFLTSSTGALLAVPERAGQHE